MPRAPQNVQLALVLTIVCILFAGAIAIPIGQDQGDRDTITTLTYSDDGPVEGQELPTDPEATDAAPYAPAASATTTPPVETEITVVPIESSSEGLTFFEAGLPDLGAGDDTLTVILLLIILILILVIIAILLRHREAIFGGYGMPDDGREQQFADIADSEPENCIYCGATEKLTREHVVQKGREPEAACTGCHLSRSDRELEEWLEYIKENREDKWEAIVEHNKGRRGEVPEHVHALRDKRPDTCVYCGSHEDIRETTIIAADKGGKKPVSACGQCFRSKGTKALMEWLRWTRENRPERWEPMVEFNKGKRGEVPRKVQKVRDEPTREIEEKPTQPAPGDKKSSPSGVGKSGIPKVQQPGTNAAATKNEATKNDMAQVAQAAKGPEECVYCSSNAMITRKHVMEPGQRPVMACAKCNLSKGKRELMYWLYWVKQNRPDRWEVITAHNKGRRTKLAINIRKVLNDVSEGQTQAKPKARAKAKTKTKTGTRSKAQTRSEAGPNVKPKTKARAKPGPKAATKPEAKAKPKPKPEPRPKAKQTPKADTKGSGSCIYCGATEKLTGNHRIAAGRKPVVACTSCNLSKGKKTLMEWLRWIKEKKPQRWETFCEHNKSKQREVPKKVQKIRDE